MFVAGGYKRDAFEKYGKYAEVLGNFPRTPL